MSRLQYETKLWSQNCSFIAGVDEVGRGCLFGDVVAAAVILPPGLQITEVDDSKRLTEKKREELYELILQTATAWAVARVNASQIDEMNIKQASRRAMKLAVLQLMPQPEHLLVDAESIDLPVPQTPIVKGDHLSQTIAAASIIAKVTRDRLCEQVWDALYPHYGLAKHKGYATKEHREALRQLGATPMHRQSFLKKFYEKQHVFS